MPNSAAGTISLNEYFVSINYLWLVVHALRLQPLLDCFAAVARTFLDFADEFFHAALGLSQIVVGDLAPFALDFARKLLELALYLIGIHKTDYSSKRDWNLRLMSRDSE